MVFDQDVNDYFTSFLSDYLRQSLFYSCDKFTFETVMSHPSKLDFIKSAKEQRFRIYLYFVALNDLKSLKKVRTLWDDETEEWYFSVVDVVGVLTDSENPRR